MRRRNQWVGLVLSLLPVVALRAQAGVLDSPVPTLSGSARASHIFTVPGIIKNNNLETDFVCTNLSTSTIHLAVETFAAAGGAALNDASSPSLNGTATVGPGATITIGTANTAGVHEDVVINLNKCKGGSVAGNLCTGNADCTGGGTCTASRCSNDATVICTADVDCGTGTCTPPLRNGSARIVSESKAIACHAFIVDKLSSPPTSMVGVKVTKAKKQNGD